MIRSTSSVARRLRARLGAAVFAAAVVASPRSSRADAGDDAFQRGKDLLDRGLLTEACEALATADHDKPSVGTIGLLAACHEKQGKTATAWREYQETARRAAAVHDERERFANERVKKVEPLVPRLVVHLPRGEKLSVTLRGAPLDPATLAAAVRVDPGPVELTATSPEGKRWSATIHLEPSEERVVEIPSLAPPTPEPSGRRGAAPPWPAIVAGSVGIVGVGITTGFGISAMTQNADSVTVEARCKQGTATAAQCARGKDERSRATAFGNVATVGLAVGAAGLGTAAVLWILDVGGSHPKPRSPSESGLTVRFEPSASASGAGLGISGTY